VFLGTLIHYEQTALGTVRLSFTGNERPYPASGCVVPKDLAAGWWTEVGPGIHCVARHVVGRHCTQ